MRRKLKSHYFLILAVCCLGIAMVLEISLTGRHQEQRMIAKFRQKLAEKEILLERNMEDISRIVSKPGFSDRYLSEMAPYNNQLEKDGIGYLIYRGDRLFYWSDGAISFRDHLPFPEVPDSPVVHFPNGYYLLNSLEADSMTLIGLILVKYSYSHKNQYLQNTFFPGFNLPENFELIKAGTGKGYPVYNRKGQAAFSIVPRGDPSFLPWEVAWPALLYLAGLLMLLLYSRKLISLLNFGTTGRLLVTAAFLFLLYWLHIFFQIPRVCQLISFFSPTYFALNFWLPSLGDFFLMSLLGFYFMLNLFWDFRINPLREGSGIPAEILALFLLAATGALYFVTDFLTSQLIYNSSLSYTLNRINEITPHTAIGIASLIMLLSGLFLLTIRMTDEVRKILSFKKTLIYLSALTLVFVLVHRMVTGKFAFHPMLFFFVTAVLSLFYTNRDTKKYGMSYLILFISVITIYSIDVIYRTTEQKEREVQKLMAVNLVGEHDPAAEVFLVEIQEQINVDPMIPFYLIPPFAQLGEYLENTYFSGFFRQYDLQITICTGSDSLVLQPQNTRTPCFPFFETMMQNQGMPLPRTNFYYLDNMDGRISYLGKLHYPLSSDSTGVSVFIDLKSRIQSEGIGFPELLIDESIRKPESYRKYNYAKYFGGELVDRHGEYPYNYYIYSYNFKDGEFTYNTWDEYEHLVHQTDEDNYVIVSRSPYTFLDYLISFPYLFVLYFLTSLGVLPLIQPGRKKRNFSFDLKFQIQFAIISIVFVSLLLVALSTIFYNIDESRTRLQEDLDRKMNSIATEIDQRLEKEPAIAPEMTEWMTDEMIRLSNTFQTDINIYGTDGNLIVSSRPEIFNRGLVSRKINSQAYFELFENFQTNYFQPEKIGKLSYLSAYEPIINNSGDYLGFINLPYFTHQDRYSQEITTYIVAFINLYVLLLLISMVFAIFIANQITLPLATIRENLRRMELGKRNEPINYDREDEIGKLVKEYNKKVDELAVSAELLARSERESAWREMAKQVAHEIKNPLTPMKLNIQHLMRFRGEGKAYQEHVNRIAQTLISQIDTLSEIATEFSNFAQIPTAMKQVFDLKSQIKKVIELYENDDRATITLDASSCPDVNVNADREQLSRALINLIKNGIQAIPEERKGRIVISANKKNHMVVLSVSDNGTGIPTELQEKMFSPNFTTKTSGMGLGLAIVKNIAENFNGRVWYETAIGEGTTFYLEIPAFEPPGGAGEEAAI